MWHSLLANSISYLLESKGVLPTYRFSTASRKTNETIPALLMFNPSSWMANHDFITRTILEEADAEQCPRKLLFGSCRNHLSNLDHLFPTSAEDQLDRTTNKTPLPRINVALCLERWCGQKHGSWHLVFYEHRYELLVCICDELYLSSVYDSL
jgi:hypothetical protein